MVAMAGGGMAQRTAANICALAGFMRASLPFACLPSSHNQKRTQYFHASALTFATDRRYSYLWGKDVTVFSRDRWISNFVDIAALSGPLRKTTQ